ncbi:hypothetical protein ACHAXT_010653 [Thalassiosira profunda]
MTPMKAPPRLGSCRFLALGCLLAAVLFLDPASRAIRRLVRHGASANDNGVLGRIYGHQTASSAQSIQSIHLIGERHSGTKWITSHLQQCFGDQLPVFNRYTRWKHWFQKDDVDDDKSQEEGRNYHPTNSSLVVAMFRDPIDWVNSMRKKPYHSPVHYGLDWTEFVRKPWTMERGSADAELAWWGNTNEAECLHRFSYNEVVPCSPMDRNMYNGTINGRVVGVTYELNHDGSGRPYDSILDLRRDKIQNFLSVANFDGVKAFLPVQLEQLVSRGTRALIEEIETISGVKAACYPSPALAKPSKKLNASYVRWMNEHVDWEVEKLVGYSRRDL